MYAWCGVSNPKVTIPVVDTESQNKAGKELWCVELSEKAEPKFAWPADTGNVSTLELDFG